MRGGTLARGLLSSARWSNSRRARPQASSSAPCPFAEGRQAARHRHPYRSPPHTAAQAAGRPRTDRAQPHRDIPRMLVTPRTAAWPQPAPSCWLRMTPASPSCWWRITPARPQLWVAHLDGIHRQLAPVVHLQDDPHLLARLHLVSVQPHVRRQHAAAEAAAGHQRQLLRRGGPGGRAGAHSQAGGQVPWAAPTSSARGHPNEQPGTEAAPSQAQRAPNVAKAERHCLSAVNMQAGS